MRFVQMDVSVSSAIAAERRYSSSMPVSRRIEALRVWREDESLDSYIRTLPLLDDGLYIPFAQRSFRFLCARGRVFPSSRTATRKAQQRVWQFSKFGRTCSHAELPMSSDVYPSSDGVPKGRIARNRLSSQRKRRFAPHIFL